MRAVLSFLFMLVLALSASTTHAQRKATLERERPPPQQLNAQTILKWINAYREKPEPNKVPEMVKAMSGIGLFKELDQAGVYQGFIAGVIGANPEIAEKLISEMFPLPPEDQVVIVRAIAYSGLKGYKELLHKFVERMPTRKVLIEHHLYGKGPNFETLDLKASPAHIDIMWGHYFASGNYKGIERIISTLPWAKDRNDVEKLTLGSMAKWTMATNLQQDPRLLAYAKKQLETVPKETAKELREVITAAETYETSAIRKQAFAAVEELRRKGPESVRNASWWGQAGQTALAFGCIVASALGQVQVGIPCVIGGALSGVALKYLTPTE
jgi:Na+-transporting methylmalonyl-CoA/oxaloacetate decarboxylase gamma subunit